MARPKDDWSLAPSVSLIGLRLAALARFVFVVVSLLPQVLRAQQMGLRPDLSLLSGGIQHHNPAMDPFGLSFGAGDPNRLFVQMAPTIHFDNHVIPAHMVGAFEKTARPEVLSLPSVPLGNVPLAGSPLSLNQNIGSDFQKAAFGGGHSRHPSDYKGKAQGLDLELQNPDTRSAMQHAGEGDHEDAVPLKDRPYNNLQSSKEQENAAFDSFAGLSGDAVLQKAISQKTTRVRKVPSDVNDITETVYRSRSSNGQHHHAPKKQKKAKKPSYQDDDEAESHPAPKSVPRKKKISRTKAEDSDDSDEQEQGRRLFNIQFGGGSRKPQKPTGRRRPPPASNEDDQEEDEQPVQESRRSLFRVPFRVFRGVTLNRGDDGALAFNINLG